MRNCLPGLFNVTPPATDAALNQAGAMYLRAYPPRRATGRPRTASHYVACFAFGARQVVLPSFGKFTGRVAIRSNKTDRIFAYSKG